MSINLAPATRPAWIGKSAQTGHLEVVSTRGQRKARPKTVYALVTVGTLLGIVVAQLLLSVAVSQGAYQLDGLQVSQQNLQRSYQSVSEDLGRRTSPQNLAANAQALGMVPDLAPAYLRLSDGKVLGSPARAHGSSRSALLVPNSLLASVSLVTGPLVTGPSRPKAPGPIDGAPAAGSSIGVDSAGSGAKGASQPKTPPGPVVLDGPLDSPTTH